MVTATLPETQAHGLPWDAFLKETAAQGQVTRDDAHMDAVLLQTRRHIDAFRATEWATMKHQIALKSKWRIPDGVEPHWVSSGRAVLWQKQVTRERVTDEKGPHVVEKDTGWAPTSPLPCNNALQVIQWLDHGLRLRPPVDGVTVEHLAESNLVVETPKSPDAIQKFWCERHPEKGNIAFPTWKAYISHCKASREYPKETPPVEVLERMRTYRYFCIVHNVGWNNARLVADHVKTESRKPGRGSHPSVKELEVKK